MNLRPFHQTVSFALICQFDIVGAIVLLYLLSYPSAIIGFVITMRIDSIDGQHVIITMRIRPITEYLKAMVPFITDPDALGSVFVPP